MSSCANINPNDNVPILKSTYLAAYASTPPFTCLPANVDTIISADGSVNTGVLASHVKSLIDTKAMAPSGSELEESASDTAATNYTKTFADRAATLRSNIQKEYCWYYKRYDWAMQKILTSLASGDSDVDQNLKNGAVILNKKLNAILLIMKGIVNARLDTLKGYYGDGSDSGSINSLNTGLDAARENLMNHSRKLQNNDLKTDVQTAMIDYSLEKNSSSRNLLAIYGFMNIIAAGLLFYVYTKSKA